VDDIFARLDAKPDEQELLDFRKTMKSTRPEGGPRNPTRTELRALAQEFSVVAKLERHKKKRGAWVVAAVVAVAAIVTAVVLMVPRPAPVTAVAGADEDFETFQRRLYAVPTTPQGRETSAPAPTGIVDKAAAAAEPTPVRRPATSAGTPGASRPRPTPPPQPVQPPASNDTKPRLSASQYAALTEDELGKSELKIDFDSSAAARKAAEEAAAKKAQRADDLSREVAGAFAKKKSQFARCGDHEQERLRVIFTVGPTGKVVRPQIEGTQSSTKSQCVLQILERSIFPAGDSELTYSQVLVL
jgi:hypothetical protein